ncbi:MAG: hypothetical protein AB1798_18470, partial [Spirochaetota bacterium]
VLDTLPSLKRLMSVNYFLLNVKLGWLTWLSRLLPLHRLHDQQFIFLVSTQRIIGKCAYVKSAPDINQNLILLKPEVCCIYKKIYDIYTNFRRKSANPDFIPGKLKYRLMPKNRKKHITTRCYFCF